MNKKFSLCLFCLSIFFGWHNVLLATEILLDDNQLPVDTLFIDDFSSTSLTKWDNASDWAISDGWLKHNLSEVAGSSYISNHLTDSLFSKGKTTWTIRMKTEFDASSSNKFWYWLMASSDSLYSSSTKGYAIGVCISGSQKNVSFYRIDGSKKTSLCATDYIWTKDSVVDLIVTREPRGAWHIGYSAVGEDVDTVFAESFTDNTYINLPYHGLCFTYTKNRAGKFYADNISIKRQKAPTGAYSSVCIGGDMIELTFTGEIDVASASEPRNYSIEGVIIRDAVVKPEEPTKVYLDISPLVTGNYLLWISNVKDSGGKNMGEQSVEFSYTTPTKTYDLVFNELMFKPTPAVGLPNYDFLELYNRSGSDIALGGWTLDISGAIRTLPDSVIKSGEYLTLTTSQAVDSLHVYGNAIVAITTSNLTNTGRTLRLISPEGKIIDSLTYAEKSIVDVEKNKGGWSLERIDPDNFCGGWNNWAYSVDTLGGTPGRRNSVFARNIDNEPVKIIGFRPVTPFKLSLELSETPTQQTLQTLSNYTVKGIGNPIGYELSNNTLALSFLKSFESDVKYELSVTNLEDACGNVMTDTVLPFTYHNVALYEMVITEVYATPSDNGVLPDYEWVEIHNRGSFDIFMNGFALGVGSKRYNIESGLVPAKSYALLAKATVKDSLAQLGNVVPVTSMPALAQSGTLILYNDAGDVVCRTAYSNSWFADDFKAAGGCSLERIDVDNADESAANWAQSLATAGATPCHSNSVSMANPDTLRPHLLQVVPVSANTLHIVFSETMNIAPTDIQKFDIQPNIGNPKSVEVLWSSPSTIVAKLPVDLSENQEYTFTIDSLITDIAGNQTCNSTFTFGLPVAAHAGDVVINEILFNPYAGGSDFVELYNRSENTINIADLVFATRTEGNLKNPKRIDSPGFVLMPGSYVAVSTDIANIDATYSHGNLYQVSALPSMPDDAGLVVLADTLGNVFDEVTYSSKMHFALLKDLNGVSLERIDYNQPADNQGNWHSASQQSGWATPGLQNSVYKPIESDKEQLISLNTEVFSPDNDGYDDQLEISYNIEEAGYVANVMIFSAKGLKMRTLANNELLGTTGFWAWDGLDDNNRRVPTGIYVIHCELFDLNGKVKKMQKACVVSTKM